MRPQRRIQFTATVVDCSEAIDWEIVQVIFETAEQSLDESDRTSPYLLINVNFEFSRRVGMEFYDGKEYKADRLLRVDLWREHLLATSKGGYEFDINFNISEEAFAELREYLRILLLSDCYRE